MGIAKSPSPREAAPPPRELEKLPEPTPPAPAQKTTPSNFQVVILKTSAEEKLGMDVKHIDGRLEVVHIFPDGAIARSNLENQRKPSGETLQLGDVIHRVN